MNKKIAIISFLAVLFLISVSMATAVNTTNKTTSDKKESPLFGIRTNRAINEKTQNLKTKFLRNRLFFLPFQWLQNTHNQDIRGRLQEKTEDVCPTDGPRPTDCYGCETQTPLTCNSGCTSRATILCGTCEPITQGIICRNLDKNC